MLGDDRLTSDFLAARCTADGEFRLAARHWTGGLRLESAGGAIGLTLQDGAAAGPQKWACRPQ